LIVARPAFADSLTLMWDANAEAVKGYVVYVGTQSGSYSQRNDVGSATTFTLMNAVAGQRYCFAVSAYFDPSAEGPKSAEACGFSNAYPTLVNPGTQTSTVGQPATLQLMGSDPDGQAVSYSASGLPPGLTLMQSAGFISGTGTTAGNYSVKVSVSDGVLSQSQSFTWTMSAPALPASDATAPTVAITSPTLSSSYNITTSTVSLGGTSADNVGVTSVEWTNSRGGSGFATGTTSWTVPSIALLSGDNAITVSARDAAGNLGVALITVTYATAIPAGSTTSSLVLTGTTQTRLGWTRITLTWSAVPGRWAEVYRNGTRVATKRNDGSYTDTLRGSGSAQYRVCIKETGVCSNTITVSY
jgi:hypothetical protein